MFLYRLSRLPGPGVNRGIDELSLVHGFFPTLMVPLKDLMPAARRDADPNSHDPYSIGRCLGLMLHKVCFH